MKSALTALVLLLLLAVAAWLLALWGSAPLPVVLTLGTTQLQTSLPVALTLVTLLLVATFYTGRLAGWFLRLPGTLLHIRHRKAGTQLAEAYAAELMGDTPTATTLLAKVTPDTETHALLADLLRLSHHLQAATLPDKLEKHLANPVSAPLAAWAGARFAAHQADWATVADLTTRGRDHAPQHWPLLVLQFKALVNTANPRAADLLPRFKPYLSATRLKQMAQVLHTSETPEPATLADSRWLTTLRNWLQTPTEDLPDDQDR